MSNGPFDIFLKLDGIDGESTIKGHENETVILSYEAGIDEVTLSYAKIHWEYQPVGPSGGPAAVVKGGWDLALNKKI
jgi:type VI protein secretion system component Hcp